MHVAFFNRSYYPDQTATGQLLTDLCEDLVRDHGCQVTVVTGRPLHPLPGTDVRQRRLLAREDRNFADYSIDIVANPRESPEIRYAAMHAFAGRMNYNNVPERDQIRFTQAVERVASEQTLMASDNGRKVAISAKELLAFLRKSFPAIEAFYANPR